MKVFIKILGLIGLINCIVLYGGDFKNAQSRDVDTELGDLEKGSSFGQTDPGTPFRDPSYDSARQERRTSGDPLLGSFALQYDGKPGQPESDFDKLIHNFKNPDNAAFAQECMKKRRPSVLKYLNELIVTTPKQRARLLPFDSDDAQNSQSASTTSNSPLLEAWTEVMRQEMELKKQELAAKIKMHQDDATEAKRQFEESGQQNEKLTRRSQCLSAAATIATLGNVAWAIYVGVTKN